MPGEPPQRLLPAQARQRLLELRRGQGRGIPAATAGRVDVVVPASCTQEGLWFLDRLLGSSGLYNAPVATHLLGPLAVPALQAAFERLIQRHGSLRTRFETTDDMPLQHVLPALDFSLTTLDGLPPGQGLAEALQALAEQPFELQTAPLLRAQLIRLAADDHVLLLNLHHIITDGWSLRIIERELSVLYNAERDAGSNELPPLPLQYTDYALWQRQRLVGALLEQHLTFWKQQLAGLETLKLPTDHPRPPLQDYAGARVEVVLPAPLLAQLAALARAQGATLFMAGLAAFALLLHRWGGSSDITIGTPIAARGRSELEGLVGFFVNTLVLRTDLSGSPSFTTLLARVRESALGAYAHAELPFEMLVKALAPSRDLSRNPLFQVCFALQQDAGSGLQFAELAAERMVLPSPYAKFDLALDLHPQRVSFEYSTALFDRATVQRMASCFATLLRSIVEQPELAIDRLPWLEAAERQSILARHNDTGAPLVFEPTLTGPFEQQALLRPHAAAVIEHGRSTSYAELQQQVDRLAGVLRARGVGPETVVALCAQRGTRAVAATLAILKTGGACLPIDPKLPPQRVRFMLDDSQAVLLLTDAATAPGLAPIAPAALPVLDLDAPLPAATADGAAPAVIVGEQLAFILYTSGTTGEPKGVQLLRRGVANHLAWITRCIGLGADDRVLHFTSPAFDASLWELLAPLQVGACLQVAEPDSERDMGRLTVQLRDQGVTILQAVPSMLQALAAEPALRECSRLRHIVSGGEALDFSLVEQLRRQLPQARLGNFYGPTEATIDATHFELDANLGGSGTVPIGRPITNTRCHVLDAQMEPVPDGVVGELFIGGTGLARGYLRRPELTAQRFVPDPFRPGQRLYRTGDLARCLGDGTLAFVGRNDRQVKLRGQRIELAEIESALAQCDGVRQAVVMLREDTPGLRRLVAYAVGTPGHHAPLDQLRQRLPIGMLPSALVWLDEWPVLPSGKIDLRRLPAPAAVAPAGLAATAPRTALEALVADTWSALLGLPPPGVHDDFFSLGGHSLLAGQLAARLSRTCGIELPLRCVFEAPTVAALAQALDRLLASGGIEPQAAAITARPPVERVELSFAQQRLWFLARLHPGLTAYNLPLALRLGGALQVGALRAALQRLIERHAALRTRVQVVDGEGFQVVDPPPAPDLALHDLRHLPPAAAEQQALVMAQADADRGFDLERGPLLRTQLVQLSEHDHLLLLNLHHIVADGWSLRIIERELAVLYDAGLGAGEATLPPLPVQYTDYTLWQRKRQGGVLLQQQLVYWKQRLAGVETVNLPADRPRPLLQDHGGARLDVELPAPLGEQFAALARAQGATLFMAGLAAFALLLHRWGGSSDITIGTPIAGRGRSELEGLVGFFANTLVLRTDLSGSPSFTTLLARVRESALGAYAHAELPFEMLVKALAPSRDLSRNPLFQVCLALQEDDDACPSFSGLQASRIELPWAHSKFDLMLTLQPRGGRLHAGFSYATALFDRLTIERLAQGFSVLVQSIVDHPAMAIDRLALLTPADRQQLLQQWDQSTAPFPDERGLAELFELQARRTPEATAVVHGTERLSYAQLDAAANQLAQALRERGVGPSVPVALCLHREPLLIVATLAIVKAGGTYVPLNPDQPAERIAWMLQDSQAPWLLTQAALLAQLPGGKHRTWCLDHDRPLIETQPQSPLPAASSPAPHAYLMYTSGSTGQPKGMRIRQRSVVRLVMQQDYLQITPADSVAQLSSVAFDAATFEIWGALLNGACLVLLDKDTVLSPPRFAAALQAHRISCMFLTTSLFNRMSLDAPDAFGGLQTLLVGGEACDPDCVRAVMKAAPPARLLNVYGPTETTTFAAFHVLRDQTIHTPVPIGRPILGTHLLLLDRHGEPVMPGAIGEICIGGDGLADGYHRQPALTHERFVEQPLDAARTLRLFRSGDLGRELGDGSLACLGRDDDQLKIRGLRVEPAEIAALLSSHPDVSACHVLAQRLSSDDVRLTAYCVMRGQAPLDAAELRRFAARQLPAYMVPTAYVALAVLPLTANGKLDVRALPAPGRQDRVADHAYAPPRDAVEDMLCKVWAEVLKLDRIGLDDNFFDAGGHSLLAARLFARIDETLGRPLPLGTLFGAPTVRQLAEHYRAQVVDTTPPRSILVALQRTGHRPALYLLPGVYGNVVGYQDFVRALGSEQPIFGLQAAGLLGEAAPFDSVAAIVACAVAEIRAHQPQGPYALAGACFGATVAFEITRQLLSAGQTVALLALIAPTAREARIDAEAALRAPRALQRLHTMGHFAWGRLQVYREDMQGLGLVQRLSYLRRKLQSLGRSAVQPNAFKGAQRELFQLEVYRANLQALDRYRRSPLVGDLRSFQIIDTPPLDPLHQAAPRTPIDWPAYWPGPIRTHLLEGRDSGDLMSGANASRLADLINRLLDEAFATSAHDTRQRQQHAIGGVE